MNDKLSVTGKKKEYEVNFNFKNYKYLSICKSGSLKISTEPCTGRSAVADINEGPGKAWE